MILFYGAENVNICLAGQNIHYPTDLLLIKWMIKKYFFQPWVYWAIFPLFSGLSRLLTKILFNI